MITCVRYGNPVKQSERACAMMYRKVLVWRDEPHRMAGGALVGNVEMAETSRLAPCLDCPKSKSRLRKFDLLEIEKALNLRRGITPKKARHQMKDRILPVMIEAGKPMLAWRIKQAVDKRYPIDARGGHCLNTINKALTRLRTLGKIKSRPVEDGRRFIWSVVACEMFCMDGIRMIWTLRHL